jgi:hypothetical protein
VKSSKIKSEIRSTKPIVLGEIPDSIHLDVSKEVNVSQMLSPLNMINHIDDLGLSSRFKINICLKFFGVRFTPH